MGLGKRVEVLTGVCGPKSPLVGLVRAVFRRLNPANGMKANSIPGWMLTITTAVTAILLLLSAPTGLAGDAQAKSARPAIYDESADGAKQIEEALARVKKENKRVLLMFGANWCGWCHRLHQLFESDAQIAAKLKQDFVVVLIDVNKSHNADVNQRYGNPTRFGLPVLVVLDAEGKALTTQDTGKLEEGDHHDPAKVLAFLNQWAPSRRSS